jgi:hypothetical protein
MKRIHFFLMATGLFLAGPAHADISIGCGGYNVAANDHVEWELKINGKDANLDGKHFSVVETKRYFILTRSDSQIRIDKTTKRYVMWGPKGKKARPIEWAGKDEGCDISAAAGK